MSPMYDLQFGEFGGYAANLANEMEGFSAIIMVTAACYDF